MSPILIILIIILALAALIFLAAGVAFFVAFSRLPLEPRADMSAELAPYAEEIEAGGKWFLSRESERVSICSYDGLELVGHFLPAEAARGTLLLIHGYHGSPWVDFGVVYEKYHSLSYNILTVHQRAHGESQGRYICFGVRERNDCVAWAEYLARRFGPEHSIVLDGISMGAATVLMSAGLSLPQSVRGIIADCGFTSPYDELEWLLRSRIHLPLWPTLPLIDFFTRHFARFSLKEASTLEAMKNCRIPVLFLHGEADTLVSPDFSRRAYEACASEKQLVTVPGAGHGMSYLIERQRCNAVLAEFLNKCTE